MDEARKVRLCTIIPPVNEFILQCPFLRAARCGKQSAFGLFHILRCPEWNSLPDGESWQGGGATGPRVEIVRPHGATRKSGACNKFVPKVFDFWQTESRLSCFPDRLRGRLADDCIAHARSALKTERQPEKTTHRLSPTSLRHVGTQAGDPVLFTGATGGQTPAPCPSSQRRYTSQNETRPLPPSLVSIR